MIHVPVGQMSTRPAMDAAGETRAVDVEFARFADADGAPQRIEIMQDRVADRAAGRGRGSVLTLPQLIQQYYSLART